MDLVHKALTIAGSDSGGGAGIQADLKTFQMREVYGMTVVTAITSQNTLGVHGICDIPLEHIESQFDAVMMDLGADAAKTGMLSQPRVIELIAAKVIQYRLQQLVIDPVMVAKGGASLLAREAVETLRKKLLPLAAVVTPNVPEAEVLTGHSIQDLAGMKDCAKRLVEVFGARSAVVKGGHMAGDPTDVLFDGVDFHIMEAKRFETRHTHGTGCTFSAAITAELAKGRPLIEAVKLAKAYITAAIEDELAIGAGHGPTNHWAHWRREQNR